MFNVKDLASKYRLAIEKALIIGDLNNDFSFCHFPRGCCGDTNDLLAQYLLVNGIKTYYVCGKYYYKHPTGNVQTHAWLWTEDKTIIDITGDQFKNNFTFLNFNIPVYVGPMDSFHKLFTVEDRDIHENRGLETLGSFCLPRLHKLYSLIDKYIE